LPGVRARRHFLGLAVLALLGGCRARAEQLEGTWERADNPGQTVTFEGGQMLHAYPHGGKPISGPYEVIEDQRGGLVIEPTIELGDGRSLRADRQRIEFVDERTMTMKNAKNGSGGTYHRRG
jgi:hypothetical protein